MTMALELKLLGVAILIGLIQILWGAAAARRQQGLKWAAGPRDEVRPIEGAAARLDRALRNFLETFPFFAAAVIVAYLGGKLGDLTLWGSVLYVAGRALYVPLYAAGVPMVRSLVWFVAMIGLGMVVAAIFL
ncbi:MAPEG family protein [Phenylobacterium sp.]|uniref:MAPEG family protein n=1 Tax=Phenylobacterium sp. TaxID=1871053 RepID=UPI002730FC3E|nr:MAPEG family protein [Phenylobacterium sp.]MDP1873786.1 MAPEG family protein [Phenylobacterium sp.]MDP3488709.1 MAPEG family protein [Phenylobacterium sp.]